MRLAVCALAACLFALPASADVVAHIDNATQRMTVVVDGAAIHSWPVSTARTGYQTRRGATMCSAWSACGVRANITWRRCRTRCSSRADLPSTARPPSASLAVRRVTVAPLQPSNELAAVVGSDPLPRPEVVSKVWDYIKKNQLEDRRTSARSWRTKSSGRVR